MGKMTKVLKTCLTGIFAAVVIVTFGIVAANVTKATEVSAEAEVATYLADGWSEYGGESVSEGAGGIVMESGAAGYSFSNTTKKAYNTDNLSVSFRLKDYIYDPSGAVTNFFIGFTPTDENFAAEDGSSYGVALISHTDNATFNAWFVQRDKNATAITGYNNLALVGGNDVKLTSTGVMTITFHREGDGQWYVWLNGIYQITVPTDCNAALTAQAQSHVAIVATDAFGAGSGQTLKLEVISIASDVLGTPHADVTVNNRIAGSSYTLTENGAVFGATSTESGTDIIANVENFVTGELDGAVFSVKNDFVNVSSYNIDLGFGTNHGAGRFTFWDSFSAPADVVGNVGIRISSNNTVIFLLMARSATEGYESVARTGLYDGALPVPLNVANEYIVQFLKINGEWHVIINGRRIFSNQTPASGAFQTYFTAVMESINNATGENVSPWLMVGDGAGKTEGFSANVTVKGFGTQRLGHSYGSWIAEVPAEIGVAGTKGHYHCSVCGKDFDADYEELDSIVLPALDGIKWVSLSLNGDIGVNFYAYVGGAASLTANGGTLVGEQVTKEGIDCFKFTVNVAAKDYKNNIAIEIDGTAIGATYKVETYIDAITNESPAYDLVQSLKVYCEAARAYFADETPAAAGAVDIAGENAAAVTGEDDGITLVGATLILEAKTAINVYFKAANIGGKTFTVGGNNVTPVAVDGYDNLYMITIDDIAAQDLDVKYTIVVGGYTVTYSALSYAYAVVNNGGSGVAIANVAKALYNYNVQANAYAVGH